MSERTPSWGWAIGVGLSLCLALSASGAIDYSGNYSTGSTITIGISGVGTLGITGGSTLSDSNAYVGFNSGSSGVATVSGSGSTWTSGDSRCSIFTGTYTGRVTGAST